MDIESILSRERTYSSLAAASKKKAIEEAAQRIAEAGTDLDAEKIFESLISREKIGTTAIGHGIAIPHCRVENCNSIMGSLFRLDAPVDFDAYDDEPVRILCVLLVPADEVEDHLKALGLLAGRFESSEYRDRLLLAKNDEELYSAAVADIGNARSA